jgi:CDP-diacylglycerol---serine O-phosphatidyltransferase
VKKYIPDLFTLSNLLCGCISVVLSLNNHIALAAIFIGIGVVFDFFDGFIARLVNSSSELGKQLDSLSDVVSFGVAPGMIVYQIISIGLEINNIPLLERNGFYLFFPFLAMIIPLLSSYRLAKFNIDTRQTENFIGLPTPANAIFFASLPLIVKYELGIDETLKQVYSSVDNAAFFPEFFYKLIFQLYYHPYVIVLVAFIFSFLLLAELPLFSLKFKNFSWNDNKHRYIFLILCFVSILNFRLLGLPISIIIYLILSSIFNQIEKSKK